jgi:2,4-dienoyl-CoA reductase (NADPH2)
MSGLKKLFEPIQIGSMVLPNRIIMPALTTLFDVEGGDRYGNFYAERAAGGAALLILGALQALYPGRGGKSGWIPDESVQEKGMVKINHDLYIPRLQAWTKAIHDAGGKAAAQIATYGFWAPGGLGAPAEEVSPSGVRLEGDDYRPGLERLTVVRGGRPLKTEEIPMIVEQIGDAAVRAQKADFDAVELQALGGNLLSRFLSPATNKRTDQYGGSLENRARMLLEAVDSIKRKLGDSFPLICRINGEDFIPGGMTLDDYKQLAPMLEARGVHAINLMPGWYETRRPMNQMAVRRGEFIYVAAGIKEVVKIPVAANIRINDPMMAEQAIADGKADLIAVCGPLIADPEMPKKAREGRLEEVRFCMGCCNCWSELAGTFKPIACSVNARVGREAETVLTPAAEPKTVWIVGGGPGGMEAARVAALRQHRVTLFEKNAQLGGQLIFADLPPHKGEWQELIRYLRVQLDKLGVDVRLNHTFGPDDLKAGKPDVLIVASGAKPFLPPIPGIDSGHVMSAVEALSGRKAVGDRVVIIGGGSVGCETAELLVEKGKQVTIVEMLDEIAKDVDFWNQWVLLDRLKKLNIQMETGLKATAITEKGVETERAGQPVFFEADSVIIAVGSRADDSLFQSVKVLFPDAMKIGDCAGPRRVKQAVEEGFMTASRL